MSALIETTPSPPHRRFSSVSAGKPNRIHMAMVEPRGGPFWCFCSFHLYLDWLASKLS